MKSKTPGRRPGCRTRLGDERGVNIVEFALASVLFFTLIFGSIVFGLAIWEFNTMANLAQEGARWASVRGFQSTAPANNTDVDNYIQSRAIGITGITVTTTWPDGGIPPNVSGKRVQVTVQKTFAPLSGLVPEAANLRLQATSQMTIAR